MQEQDLARIRLVTRRYDELQGLGRVALGVGFVAGSLVADQVLDTLTAWWAFLLPLAAAASIAVPGKLASDRLYEQRFGRVRKGGEMASPGALWPILFGVTFGVLASQKSLAPHYPNLPFLVVAVVAARRFLQDWPLRKYLILDVLAVGVAISLQMPDIAVSREMYDETRYVFWWKAFGLMGVSAIMTGMLDHRLLTSTLRGRQVSDVECEHVDPV